MLISYLNFLITNVIIALGAVSVFNWISLVASNKFISKYRSEVQTVFGLVFLGYLFIETLVNTYVDPRTFGTYWTSLNMIIVAMFILNLMTKSYGQVLIFIVLAWVTLTSFARPVGALSLLMFVLFGLELFYMQRRRQYILAHRAAMYGALLVFAATSMALVYGAFGSSTVGGAFWLRQVGAFVVLSVSALEYNRALTNREKHAVVTATKASHDGLTGLRNFAVFNRDLKDEFALHESEGHMYSLCELDVDHFKAINDSYGHPKGNDVLRRVASRLANEAVMLPYPTRSYRLGGEEFCLLIDGELRPEEEHKVAESVRDMIAKLDLAMVEQGISVTASVGITHVGRKDNNYLAIYTDVDKCLYDAKRRGRNSTAVRALMDVEEFD